MLGIRKISLLKRWLAVGIRYPGKWWNPWKFFEKRGYGFCVHCGKQLDTVTLRIFLNQNNLIEESQN